MNYPAVGNGCGLWGSLVRHAGAIPLATAATFLTDGEATESITYAQLDARAGAIARSLIEAEAGGQRVLVAHPPGLEFIAAMYGCWYAGCAAIPSYPPGATWRRTGSRFGAIVADSQPAVALTTAQGMQRVRFASRREPGLEGLRWLATDAIATAPAASLPPVEVASDSLAVLQYTSGSTGAPKGVMLSHRNLLSNIEFISAKMAIPHEERKGVYWLPPYHDMGLIGGILTGITRGFPLILMDPAYFLERPLRWLTAISDYGGTISVAPNFAYDLCVRATTPEQRRGLDLSKWRVAGNGAEPVRRETMARFCEAFGPVGFRRQAFVPCYGLAEATLGVTCGSIVEDPPVEAGHVSCGRPEPSTRVVITDPEGGPLPEGRTGEIRLAGPGVSSGYWRKPQETSDVFGQAVEGFEGAFLRTGDLGFLKNGELYVTGRLKDLIIVRGRNLCAHDIEAAAEVSHPAIAPDSTAAFPIEPGGEEQLAIMCEIRRESRHHLNAPEIIDGIKRAIVADAGVSPSVVLLVKPGAIPRTTSGKIRRFECRRMLEHDEFEPIASCRVSDPDGPEPPAPAASDEEISLAGRIRLRIASMRRVEPAWLDYAQPISMLGVDSLMRTELLLWLESEFQMSLDSGIVEADQSILDIVSSIESRRSNVTPAAGREPRPRTPAGEYVPMTPPQKRFLQPDLADPREYSIVAYVRVPPFVNEPILGRALELTEMEFDALRLRFRLEAGEWRQRYAPPGGAIAFESVAMSGAGPDAIAALRARLEHDLPKSLDLDRGPLVRGVHLDRGPLETGLLVLCMHHLVIDGLSVAIFAGTIERNLRALLRGADPIVVPAAPSFGQWAEAVNTLARSKETEAQLDYWSRVCGPGSVDRPGTREYRAHAAQFLEPAEQLRLEALLPLARDQQDLFLAAFWKGWEDATGEPELLVQLQNHGRGAVPSCLPVRTLGWFVCEFPIRLKAAGTLSGEERVRTVRSLIDSVPGEGGGYGMLRFLHPEPAVRARMDALASPPARFRYPRYLHHASSAGLLEVIMSYVVAASVPDRLRLPVSFEVEHKNGVATWNVSYNERVRDAEFARTVLDGAGRFVKLMLASKS